MKNIGFYLLMTAAFSFSSCADFLEEHPKSFLSPDNFYQTAEDINAGLNAVYRAPQDRYSRNWAGPCWFEWGTDICEITDKSTWAHHNEIARLPSTFNASSEIPEDFWEYTFNHVKDANNLLAVLPNAPIGEEDKLLVEGQTRALRAFLYFDAVRVFNGVPLLLESNSDVAYLKSVPRATPEEIYAAVIEDLQFAIEVLPEQWESATDYGRITKGGAAAMLAKVYLTMAGYPLYQTDKLENAKTILQDFIENKVYGSQYELLPEYSQVFDENVGPGNEGVWIINFTRSTYDQGSRIHTEFAPLELYYAAGLGLTYGGGWSNGLPTDRFYNSYDKENDNYVCPMGKKLYRVRRKEITYMNSKECKTCPNREKCTKAKRGKQIKITENEEYLERARKRQKENMNLYKERQKIVEHVFGSIKRDLGYTYLLLRGNEKVKGESFMHFLVYNIKRVCKIKRVKEIIEAIEG